ncbi:MAG: cellobiose phosphorylase, partial [bacterium]
LKEDYRHKTRFGFSGREKEFSASQLIPILNNSLKKIDAGIEKAKDPKKELYYSYFINEVTEYDLLKEHYIIPKGFIQKRLPLFLEGQMHSLRLAEGPQEAKKIYRATKTSNLFDKKLKMYKVTDCLKSMPEEIGRCRVFSPGWLEHESIWLHMEYKYLLETLKKGLYEEFFEDFKNVLIPFQDPQRYGRSILENSSFLVSSAFVDKNLHGNGYVARLSGSTAEFIQLWLIMNLGQFPFALNKEGKLNLQFRPTLAGWLFTKDGTYSFNFLRKVRITYHNPARKNTFGKSAAKIKKIVFKDTGAKLIELDSDTIPSPYAAQVRSAQIQKIDVYLK